MVQPSFQPKSIFKTLLVHHFVFIKVSFSPDSLKIKKKKKKFLSRQDFRTWPEPKMQYVNLCKGLRPNLYGIIRLKYSCGLRDALVEVLDWAPWGTCIGLQTALFQKTQILKNWIKLALYEQACHKVIKRAKDSFLISDPMGHFVLSLISDVQLQISTTTSNFLVTERN